MTRRALIFLLLPLLLAAIALPAWRDSAPASPGAPLFRARRALASDYAAMRQQGEVNPAADKVYGQLDFVSNAPGIDEYAFTYPSALFVSSDTGQIFVADAGNNRVLIWDSVDNYINGNAADTVIGQPDFTSTAAPNPPTAASLNTPSGLALDFWGNLYVADTGNNRVLVYEPPTDPDGFPIFSDGMDATLVVGQADFTSNDAPTPPTAASLNQPTGLAIDYYDNLVVADTNNNRVLIFEAPLETGMAAEKVLGHPLNGDPRYGDFTANQLANPPTAVSLNHPTGVAIGAVAEELYVADTGNNRVLVYTKDPLDGQADRVIGQPGFTSKAANNDGLSAASLNGPTGLRVDSANRLFVADTGNNRVLQYENPLTYDLTADQVFGQKGDFTTGQANKDGLSETGLNAPMAVATDEAWMDVYIADTGNHRALQYFDPLPNAVPFITELNPGTVKAGSAGFTLEIWGTGIIDATEVRINGAPRAVKESYLGLVEVEISAAEVASGGSLNVTLVNPAPGGGISGQKTLAIYTPAAGDTVADGVLGQPDLVHNETIFIPTEADNVWEPAGITIAPDGRIFVADSANSRVLRWPGSAHLAGGQPADLVIGQPDFETADYHSPTLGGPGLTAQGLDYPLAAAIDSDGTLFVSDWFDNRVLVYDPPLTSGMAATAVLGQPDFDQGDVPAAPAADNLNGPLGLAVDAAGRLFVADGEHNRVLVFEPPFTTGQAASLVIGQPNFTSAVTATVSAASLNYPFGLAFDAGGNLYVADSHNHRVLIYTPPFSTGMMASRVLGQGGDFTTNQANKGGLSAASLYWPTGVAVDSARNLLYVSDGDNHRVLLYQDPLNGDAAADNVFGQAGSFTTGEANKGGLSAASLSLPMGVAVDAAGNLLIADSDNNRVLTYLIPNASGNVYLPIIQK